MRLNRKDLGISVTPPPPPEPEKVVEVREVKVPTVDTSKIISDITQSVESKLNDMEESIADQANRTENIVTKVLEVVSKDVPKREFVLKIKRNDALIIESIRVVEL